ncbi:MAG: transcription antitermination factor NusB [Firmicutes bacterium]|nr:transcription antitermination factor NusB [Bacillota bacterium]
MSRSQARENTFMLVYERNITGEKNADTFLMLSAKTASETAYISAVYNGIDAHLDFLTKVISKSANDYAAARIYKVDFSVLLVAVYEILFIDDVPDAVAVNEALELAKRYSTDKSASFINGVLARVIECKESILESFKNPPPEAQDGEAQDEGENTDARTSD